MATYVPPVIITDRDEEHPAKRCRAGYITVGVIEVVVSLTIIIIGAINLNQAIQDINRLERMPENTLKDFSNSLNDQDGNSLLYDDGQKYLNAGVDTVSSAYLGFGIFTGVFFLITAALGITSGSCPNTCNIVGGMVMCIFSALFAGFRFCYGLGVYFSMNILEDDVKGGVQATHIISISCSAIMFFTAITHSALCCAHSCCKGKSSTTATVVQHTIPMQPGYPNGIAPYYDHPPVHQGYTPEYVDDRMNRKLIEG